MKNKYSVSYNKDSIDLVDSSTVFNTFKAVKSTMTNFDSYRSDLGLTIFPKIQDADNPGNNNNLMIDSNHIRDYLDKSRCLGSTLSDSDSSVLTDLCSNLQKTTNLLYNYEHNLQGFEIDYVDICLRYDNAREKVSIQDLDKQYDSSAYEDAVYLLNNISKEYTENYDGSRTYKTLDGTGEITLLNGLIVRTLSNNHEYYDVRYYDDGQQFTKSTRQEAETFFSEGKPLLTNLKDSHLSVLFGEGEIQYSFYNGGTYERFPQIKKGSIDINMADMNYSNSIIYTGEYVEYENEYGAVVQAPLATYKYENGQIIVDEMSGLEKARYIGEITKYYNDIEEKLNNTTEKFSREVKDDLKAIYMINLDNSFRENVLASWSSDGRYSDSSALCHRPKKSNKNKINIFTDEFIDLKEDNYDFMVDGFIHECGHAYANNHRLFADFDDSSYWKRIYDNISSNEINVEFLGDYAFTNSYELFAESTRYFFSEPERLKMVQIDDNESLYDVMNELLN